MDSFGKCLIISLENKIKKHKLNRIRDDKSKPKLTNSGSWILFQKISKLVKLIKNKWANINPQNILGFLALTDYFC